jgi:MraZ protein
MLVLWPHDKVKPEREFGFIKGLTMRQFDLMMEKLEAKRAGGKDVGAARRKIYGNSCEISVDPAGRLCLPPKFAAKIGLGTEARFVGAGSHFEIWDPAIFKTCTEAECDLADEGYDDLI